MGEPQSNRIQMFPIGPNTAVGSIFHVKLMLPTDGEIKMTRMLPMCVANPPSSLMNHAATEAPDRLCTVFNANARGGGWGKALECETGERRWPHKSQG